MLYHNYEFWNFRALRQYLHFLLSLEQHSQVLQFEVYESVILPYVFTIQKPVKKAAIMEELALKVIDKVHRKGTPEELKMKVNNSLHQSITNVLQESGGQLLEKLSKVFEEKTLQDFRTNCEFANEFEWAIDNQDYLTTRARDLLNQANDRKAESQIFLKSEVGQEVN
jgi:hypothetical protein